MTLVILVSKYYAIDSKHEVKAVTLGEYPHLFECCFIVGTALVDIVIKVQTVICYQVLTSYTSAFWHLYDWFNVELL